jgi:hypothetical protein
VATSAPTPSQSERLQKGGYAKRIVIDDHTTIVRGRVEAGGWKDVEHVEIAPPVSAWIDEIRPEARVEFFDAEGDMLCGNGNVDLVQALLAGGDILC